jgi:hypothetical protein
VNVRKPLGSLLVIPNPSRCHCRVPLKLGPLWA